MHALIDADRIAYCYGGMKDEEGYPQAWEILRRLIDDNIASLNSACGATSSTLYLTSDDKSNFRFKIATILPYKGNRKTDKPFWYEQIRRYLVDVYSAVVVYGQEADDQLGIKQLEYEDAWWNFKSDRSVICSVDKDLDLIPGLHYNELKPEKGVYEISEVDAQRNFFCQLLTGDSTDNIPGLYGVGGSSTLLRSVRELDQRTDMYLLVKEQYVKRFGSYWKLFMYENAQLLWILRTQNHNEIIEELERIEQTLGKQDL